MLNNRALFHKEGYCRVDKKAVILHPIKYAPIWAQKRNKCNKNINMSKFFKQVLVLFSLVFVFGVGVAHAQYQLPDSGFEDWSGAAFNGEIQNKYWHASNVEQVGFKFNFAHRETGRNGGYCIMAQDQSVGAMGITETSPSYYSLGYGWQHLDGLNTGSATAGTKGGYAFAHRPDSISVWIKRTGNNTDKEDFHIVFYSWTGTAKGASYKNKNGGCTSVSIDDEESDIRISTNGNECKTTTPGGQVAEGWLRDRKTYNNWVNVRIPIYYMSDNVPAKCNLIFSASNYPNFRSNSGLYEGNSLYVDDLELIYSSKIHTLRVGGKEWKGFDPNSSEVQVYSLPEGATAIPTIEAYRGAGSLTNTKNITKTFPGRKLSGSEISISGGALNGAPVTITVRAEDGSSTTVYKVLFQTAASSNANLASISYTYTDKDDQQHTENIANFSPSTYNYQVELPYGAKGIPSLSYEKQEDEQSVNVTQPTSLTGMGTLAVTAANGSTKSYRVTFSVGQLSDNTLAGIKVNGKAIPGFTPSQTVYKVSLPVGTQSLSIEPVSAYPQGEQSISIMPATLPTGDAINGSTVQVSVTTPGNPIAKVYKLNLKLEASSYAYLQDITVEKGGYNYMTEFEPTQTTYYFHMPLGTTSLPTISWVNGDEYQTVTKTDLGEGVVDGTVRITVTAGNGDQTVYKLVFTTEKSDRSTLNGILIGGEPLPGFDPDLLTYSFNLPIGTTVLPEIIPVPGDEWQTFTITPAGVNGKTRISVTAGDGSTSVYQISFSVASYSVNTLKGLYLDGVLIEGFAPETDEYQVSLPQGTTALPEVTYTLENDQLQSASVRPLSGLNGDYKITVRPQSGASRTYIIHFSVATSSNTNLGMIYLDGTPLAGFAPDILHYTDSLPEGVSTIPTVSFDKGEATQRVLSVLSGKTQTITVTAESGAKKEYIIDFIVRVSENAFLDMIYLNGDTLDGFSKQTLEYEVQLTSDRCPAITVDKAPGQQVTITAPYAAGVAKIVVTPEAGSSNEYKINFVPAPAQSVQLSGILVNGDTLPGFEPTQLHYHSTYEEVQPTVEGIGMLGQTMLVLWKDSVAWIHVSDAQNNKTAYSITFTRIYSGDNALELIYADGDTLQGFDPAKLHYIFELDPGSTYPQLSYKAADKAQVVFFGQTAPGKWSITVVAENGTKATYTVQYTIRKHTDATLKNIIVEGYSLPFEKTTYTYGKFTIQEGVELPNVTAVTEEGQSVIVYNENDSVQRVQVMAENGAENTYTITYHRVKSSIVQLENILIDGTPLLGFHPDTLHYTVQLPRDAKVVPNVNPLPLLENQTVTTYVSCPNGVTRIHVVAQDGTEGEYTIAFPLDKSDNTLLKKLVINGETKDVNVTEYTFDVPFGQVNPYDISYEIEDGQLVRFIDAPLSGTTKIIVTNEKGNNSRTYTINYVMAVPQGVNKVKRVAYSYVNAADEVVNGELQPVAGENIINLPFGAKSFEVTEVEKNYPEQTIYFYNGGIRRGATIIATSNRSGEDDVNYTITPVMPAFETAGKLKELKFKGNLVPKWRSDVYNYMINVTAQPTAADFTYETYEAGKSVTVSAFNAQKKQVTFTVDGGEQYSVCWFYPGDEAPLTFNWEQTESAMFYTSKLAASVKEAGLRDPTGYRPHSWHVPADLFSGLDYDATVSHFVYYTGKEVTRIGNRELILSTIRGGALNSSIPGAMTLGGLSLPDGVQKSGNTKVSFVRNANSGVTFRNTPEKFEFDYQPISNFSINTWTSWIGLGNGSTQVDYEMSGDFNDKGVWKTKSQNLSYNFVVSKLNILMCSSEISGSSFNVYSGGTSCNADLQISNLRFVYNSELTAVKVNGKSTVKDGNTFTYTLAANEVIEGIPALKFTGAVHDQTQTIAWLNNGEWIDGELKARVVNYGENSKDSTIYTVVLKRTPETSTNFTAAFGTFPTTKMNDTILVNLPYGIKQMPNLTITPNSTHQIVTMSKKGNAVTVHVTAENGADSTAVFVFKETKADDVEFESALSASDKKGNDVPLITVDPLTFTFRVEVYEMPTIEYLKKQGQLVDINYGLDTVLLSVTAQDGITTRTYTIERANPVVVTSGQIEEFTKGGQPWAALGGTTYSATEERPEEIITFERKDYQDSVVYVQTPQKMEWQVYGSTNHTYVLNYPTALSNNAKLATILVNGTPYSEYSLLETEYTIESDTMLIIGAVAAELEQKIVTEQAPEAGEVVVYNTTVTAADGVTKTPYRIAVRHPKSNNATLAGILLDSVMISGFVPGTFDYDIVLPLPASGVKSELQQMPNVTYMAGQEGQSVELTIGAVNGDATELTVHGEDGLHTETYTLNVTAAKSHCSDLTGITVNGEAIADFEPGRHFYSISLTTENIELDFTADDRFLTVETLIDTVKTHQELHYTLRVTAEDGTKSDYHVEIYIEHQSNDAQLANITLDGLNFEDFLRDINDLKFDGGQNLYDIHLHSGTTVLPEVSAQLKMQGQHVEIIHTQDTIKLNVTAVDGITHNVYLLCFDCPRSTNANLSMIFLNGDTLPGFDKNYYFYQINLPEGVHTMPEVVGQKDEAVQTLDEPEIDTEKLQVTLRVHAEDPTARENAYVVVFHITESNADTLLNIYEDGQPMADFAPRTMYYTKSLPVGTVAFPDISWEEVNDLQTIVMDTVEYTPNSTLIRQIKVTAESGKKNVYTVSYTIEKSSADTLQMIFVDKKQLPNFKPSVVEYVYWLTAAEAAALNGALPVVEYTEGDEVQEVMVSQAPDSLSGKSLGYKSLITVRAAAGNMNIYTIHYPVSPSTDATLNMINISGKPLTNYDSERFNYKLEIEMEASIPVVSVIKKEEAQVYEIRVLDDTVKVVVWAESLVDSAVYTLTFERLKSKVTELRDIILRDADGNTFPTAEFPYRQDVYSYNVKLEYNSEKGLIEQLPTIEIVKYDEEQDTTMMIHHLPSGDIQVDITVTAPNEEDQAVYSILFHFQKPSDALLAMLLLHGEEFPDFRPTKTEYVYAHPYGTTPDQYYSAEDVSVVLSDSLATDSIYVDEEGVINIVVLAQDGRTSVTYLISQTTAEDGDNALAWITIDGDTIPDFDPEQTFYIHYVFAGAMPSIDAAARSENAEVDLGLVTAGDTCVITCTAADGKDRYYYVYFALSEFNPGNEASGHDVLVKRVPGSSQIFIATIRNGVDFALFDQNGHMVYYRSAIPTADPNNVDVYTDAEAKEVLNDIDGYTDGLTVDVQLGQPYFYVFFSGKKKIASGSIIAL